MSDNIKVVVKVRPLIARELEEHAQVLWRARNNKLCQLDHAGRDTTPAYTFDKVYDKGAETEAVYNDIAKPIVEAVTAGINGTIFAYGQTSSGKTYTMMGDTDSPGIIPLAVYDIFERIKNIPSRDFLLRVSYIEIYNETIKDLLSSSKEKIKVFETVDGSVKVDATEKVTSTPEGVLEIMKEGEVNRQVGATNMNEKSSRSHTIFQITIESREHTEGEEEEAGCVNVSQLNLVDLAGSERAGQTGATGVRFREGTHINKSLSALGLVIMQLSEDPHKFVNYRDSKLTRILQNSLGGNAKTSIICAVTPAAVEETISTLQFANRAKAIKNKPEVNAVATNATMLQSLTKKLASLQYELDNKKHLEQDNEKLMHMIEKLQKQIMFGMTQPSERVNRRKTWCAPRRATISTLLPIQEESALAVPRFCTPSLKYNKSLQPESTPVVMMRRASDIPEGNEEEEQVTPPPRRRNLMSTDEVITLDDSDDEKENIEQTCSPYHGCYVTSKTPPCVLRDKCKKLEHSYNDLVELTEREKIYSPQTVELMERLDKNSFDLENIRDDFDKAKTECEEKDKQITLLKEKIIEYEQGIKENDLRKVDFEMQRKEYETRLTDLEICLENCKHKAKQREMELLSLFEKDRNTYSNSYSLDKSQMRDKALTSEISAFMNLSKDISLVDSEVETSVPSIGPEKLSSSEDIKIWQAEINEKNDLIRELNKKLSNSQQNIKMYSDELESWSTERVTLLSTLSNFKKTIEELNNKLVKANKDIKFYDNVVSELKQQLHSNEHETKEKLLSSNEEMSNVISSLKKALELKNKETQDLETEQHKSCVGDCQDVINEKNTEIITLENDILNLKQMLDSNQQNFISLSDEKTELLQNNNKLLKDCEKLTANTEASTEEIEKLKSALHNSQAQLILNKEECNQLHVDIAVLKKLNIDAVLESKDLQSQIHKKNEEENKTSKTCFTLLSENDLLKGQLEQLELNLKNNAEKTYEKQSIIDNLGLKLMDYNRLLNEAVSNEKDLTNQIEHHRKLQEAAMEKMTEKDVVIKQINYCKTECERQVTLLKQELEDKCLELQDVKQNMENNKDKEILVLQDELSKLTESMKIKDVEIKSLLTTINELRQKIQALTNDVLNVEQLRYEIDEKEAQLSEALNKIKALIVKIDTRYSETSASDLENLDFLLEKLDERISSIKQTSSEDDDDACVSNLKGELTLRADTIKILQITIKNQEEDLSNLKKTCNEKSIEINRLTDLHRDANNNLLNSQNVMDDLKIKLQVKTNQINGVIARLSEIDKFIFERLTKFHEMVVVLEKKLHQINEKTLNYDTSTKVHQLNPHEDFKPPTLKAICLKKVHEDVLHIYTEPDKNLRTNFALGTQINLEQSNTEEKCHASLVNRLKNDNLQLLARIKCLETSNRKLESDFERVNEEVKMLLVPADDLYKQISKHRTHLSTLTATTYAENKLLKTKVKALHHHHDRLHNVCQREIPELRDQLYRLRHLLEEEFGHNTLPTKCSFSEYNSVDKDPMTDSPEVQSNEISMSKFSMATLGSEILMLGNNFTLGPSANSTMISHEDLANESVTVCENIDVTEIPHGVDISCQTDEQVLLNKSALDSSLKNDKESNQRCCNYALMTENCPLSNDILKEELNRHSKSCIIKKKYHIIGPVVANLVRSKEKEIEIISKTVSTLEHDKVKLEKRVQQMENVEDEICTKTVEIKNLSLTIQTIKKEIHQLQTENESLSNDLMESILENDVLKNALTIAQNDKTSQTQECLDCMRKDDIILSLKKRESSEENILCESNKSLANQNDESPDISLTKNSLRREKICSLHNELLASRQDCQKINDEMSIIRNQLSKNEELTMKMQKKLKRSTIAVDNPSNYMDNIAPDVSLPNTGTVSAEYENDKRECINFLLIKKINTEADMFQMDKPVIAMMKHLYDSLWIKHSNDLENFMNKIKHLEDDKTNLQMNLRTLSENYDCASIKLQAEIDTHSTLSSKLSVIKDNHELIQKEISTLDALEIDINSKCVSLSQNILEPIDKEFGFSTSEIFKRLLSALKEKYEKDLISCNTNYANIKEQAEALVQELKDVRDKFALMKEEFSQCKKELELLKSHKELMLQINNAVTNDLVAKEESLKTLIEDHSQMLIDKNVLCEGDIDLSLPTVQIVSQMFGCLKDNVRSLADIDKDNASAEALKTECNNFKLTLESATTELREKERQIDNLKLANSQYAERTLHYESVVKDIQNENILQKQAKDSLNEEMSSLKNDLSTYVNKINYLEQKVFCEMVEVKKLQSECATLQTINAELVSENKEYCKNLEVAGRSLAEHERELKEVKTSLERVEQSNKLLVNSLDESKRKSDAQSEELIRVNKLVQEKTEEVSLLEKNIKTHQKTTDIQTSMYKRLQKEKEEIANLLKEKSDAMCQLSSKCDALQTELDDFRSIKHVLEAHGTGLSHETDGSHKSGRNSLDTVKSETRRRRQSFYDMRRTIKEDPSSDQARADEIFGSCPTASTSTGYFLPDSRPGSHRSSLEPKMDYSVQMCEGDESRGGVTLRRRRRQSLYDMHRTSAAHSLLGNEDDLSPVEELESQNNKIKEEYNELIEEETPATCDYYKEELARLRRELHSCRTEHSELQERFRELDEECETCAEYLREREDQCYQLKQDKAALEQQLEEAFKRLGGGDAQNGLMPPSTNNSAVNTDNDWLHSAVVDRMSYDAEVEKRKKLAKAVEDLRGKNKELKTAVGKLQTQIAKSDPTCDNTSELQTLTSELESCRREHLELQERYRELDEECETCAEYLREREGQCQQLKQDKAALEDKVTELQQSLNSVSSVIQSTRKKRQSSHDVNRDSGATTVDAATNTDGGALSGLGVDHMTHEAEKEKRRRLQTALDTLKARNSELGSELRRLQQIKHVDENTVGMLQAAPILDKDLLHRQNMEIQQLRAKLEEFNSKNALLEQHIHSLLSAPPSPAPTLLVPPPPPTILVATGSAIVQNQQLSDFMKENQRLKKINTKLVNLCMKRGKQEADSNQENVQP